MSRGSHASPAHRGGPEPEADAPGQGTSRRDRLTSLATAVRGGLTQRLRGGRRGGSFGGSSGGSGRRLAWRIGTPLVVVICGALLVISGENSEGTDLRPGRYTDLATLVQTETSKYDALEAHRKKVAAEVEKLTKAVPDAEVRRYQQRVQRLEDPAGLTPRRGPGVQITLSDAPSDMLEQAPDNNTAKLMIVHQQDIQAVVNALWRGGATAVTVQGKRVITTTGIKCSGSTVQLQGVPYPAPYVLRAVGDPAALTAAIDADPDVSLFREDAANPALGLGWQMSDSDDITAPAYDGALALHYAKPLS